MGDDGFLLFASGKWEVYGKIRAIYYGNFTETVILLLFFFFEFIMFTSEFKMENRL